MSTHTCLKIPANVYDAIFGGVDLDLPVIEQAAKIAAPQSPEQKLLLSLVRGAHKAKKEHTRTARYLRHYRKIASKLV